MIFHLNAQDTVATRNRFEEEALPQVEALQAFALQLCRDEQYSRDLVQETMLKALMYFHTYQEGTNCRAWLFQICKNSYINEAKRRKLQPVCVDFQVEESGDYANGSEEEVRALRVFQTGHGKDLVETESLSDEVMSAIDALPKDYQTALVLCDLEEYPYEEIAGFVQAPVGTIRSRIHRGRKMLADRLRSYARSQGYADTSFSAILHN